MELRSEEKQEKENKGRKIIVISIVILIALIIITGVAIVILKQAENKKMKLSVDGKYVAISSNLIVEDEITGEYYYSVEQVAKLTGYAFYNGEYKKYSEDKTKCYVECQNEVAMLEMGLKTIYKSNSKEKVNFDAYKLSKPIKSYNGALYINSDSIQTVFNTKVSHDQTTNTIIFNTLPYLVDYYSNSAKSNGYKGICEDFATQKAILKNLLVVNKDDSYGVVSIPNGNTIIGNKYSKIEYIETTEEFIVTNEGKSRYNINRRRNKNWFKI